MDRVWTDVVAAVVYQHGDPNGDPRGDQRGGSYLLAQRPTGKAYAGYWEFPGGKVEPGETLDAAIKREIREELGIEIDVACPWLLRTHVYEHAAVRLHFFRIREWRGTPQGLEAQRFAFQVPGRETVSPMLPANGPILTAVGLPQVYGITNAVESGVDAFMHGLEAALTKGLRLVQVRDKGLPETQREAFAQAVTARCHAHDARVLVNGDAGLAARSGADGLHLTAQQLMQMRERPAFALVGASVHSREQLDHAVQIGCDFAVLGPVKLTATHPGADTLGWDGFARIAAGAGIPVYAIGGMQAADVYPSAWQAGAHGVAMMRAAWQ